MKICFSDITHDGHSFIWESSEDNKEATCTLQLTGTKEPYNEEDLKAKLKKVKGITFTDDGKIIIKDLESFHKIHPMMPICDVKPSNSLINSLNLSFLGNNTPPPSS